MPDRPAPARLRRPTPPFATPRTIAALILREMASTYGKSPGGYAWVVLEPALGIALLSAIFAFGFRTPSLGQNFAMFFATGILPFMMFMSVSGKLAQAVNYSKALLQYPRVTFADTLIARFVLTALTQLLVGFILLTAIRVIWETRTVLLLDRAILAYLMAMALGIGVGTMNCFLMTMFPLWQQAWSILTRPLFLVSGVILLFESLPQVLQDILWFNPLMHVTGEMRDAFYLQYDPTYVSPAYVFGVALVLTLFGLIFLRHYHRDMLER
jgi:capsular polysaccharide transport system permease protein